MILLTRLSGDTFEVNSIHIESVEAVPDTRVTLDTGKQYYVRETPAVVRERMRTWFRSLYCAESGADVSLPSTMNAREGV
jgi:flagellar protein FlbD